MTRIARERLDDARALVVLGRAVPADLARELLDEIDALAGRPSLTRVVESAAARFGVRPREPMGGVPAPSSAAVAPRMESTAYEENEPASSAVDLAELLDTPVEPLSKKAGCT